MLLAVAVEAWLLDLTMTEEPDNAKGETDLNSPAEIKRRQRSKNLALAGVLVGLAVLFYLVAIVRIGGM